MVRPKMLGDVQSLTNSAQNKEYFSSKYSLKAKAGGNDGLIIGQEIYCIPLVKNGVYELATHCVKKRGNDKGFKNSKFNAYIPCHGVNVDTGEFTEGCTCCRLAQEEWDKFVANNKQGETMISFKSSRFYIPIMLLGNDTGSKTAAVPVTKLTLKGRDYSYIELSQKAFNEMIAQFKNELVNNGRISYDLNGAELYNEILAQLQKHILKISIMKPDTIGTHKKVYSFIPFTNQSIGAETGDYQKITLGLEKIAKLATEAAEFVTLFESECEGLLMQWEDVELENYIHGVASVADEAKKAEDYSAMGVAPRRQANPVAKEEQVVIEEEAPLFDDDADDDLFDGEDDLGADLTLDDTPNPEPVATAAIDLDDDGLSFDLDEEDFFGDE